MSARIHGRRQWLIAVAAAATITGCAADGGGKSVRKAGECPMSFTMVCEARQPGAVRTYSSCRCVRQADLLPVH